MATYTHPASSLPASQRQALAKAGLSAGLEYFNGKPERFDQYMADRRSKDPRASEVGRLASRAALFVMADLLAQLEAKGSVTFTGHQPPTADEFLYIAARNEDDVFSPTCGGVIVDAVNKVRAGLPGVAAAPAGDPVKKISIVSEPDKTVETVFERDRQTMEITKSVAKSKQTKRPSVT